MISKANSRFLEMWKDFPGSNIVKYAFVIIGGLTWFEFFYPEFKFASHVLGDMFASENIVLGVISFSGIFGILACAFLWFPSYIFCCIKAIGK
jgi:uncharacterized membrane protein YuzA (DUF378 family)